MENGKWPMENHSMNNPVDLPNIRIITVSGRIGAGSTSLAKNLAKTLNWKHIEGGEVFWEAVRRKNNLSAKDTNLRPDDEDVAFDERLKEILHTEKHIILETKLAGFLAQGLTDIYKFGIVCEDVNGQDQTEIRIDRLVNREQLAMDDAKTEVLEREKNDVQKWRKLYVKDDDTWVYWKREYFDCVINTYSHNPDESLQIALKAIGYTQ